MVARVEARLRQFPDDGNGWNVIAPVYMRQQRFADAQEAYRKAILLLGETPERLSGFGEAATLANNGIVTPAARLAFEKALASKPDLVMARFWLSTAQEEAGELQAARAGYAHLLTLNLREDWRRGVEEKIAQLDARIANEAALAAPTSSEQLAMIEGMVARLAARLDESGGDLSEWLKLMRAYSVLGRQEEAATTLQKARAANAGNEAALKRLEDFAAELGLRS
jgi:cytochrome c-type biogenesis protein CcmH